MRLRFTTEALANLNSIYDYLVIRNEPAARRAAADIRTAAARLLAFPHMARKGQVSGTHEWVVRGTPYLLVYEVDEANAEIVVLAVFHGAQDWQNRVK
jgi:plasmid stabilization system protein ParE